MVISYADFEKVDLRSGTVIKVEPFPRAKKPAYKVWVDFGNEIGVKQTSAQVTTHYTPVHGSWLNMAEIELSHLNRQCLDRRILDKEAFINEVSAWNKQRNKEAAVSWQFTTADARIKLKKLYSVLSQAGQNQ